jgi:hypothetical protein
MTEMNEQKPPSNARRVFRWNDLPETTGYAWFRVTAPGAEPRKILVRNHQRQVLEGLMQAPIYAASYCRISDQVLSLRRDHGLDIECEMYRNDPETGRERYGVYVLRSKVERIEMEAAA